MSNTKAALKEAREAIKNKDFKTSLKLLKSILRTDKENYMALVLLGVTLRETGPKDQAPLAFKKATATDKNQPLAWQGLADYYEKESTLDAKKELLPVYEQLLITEPDFQKFTEYVNKLSKIALELQETETVIQILSRQTQNNAHANKKLMLLWSTIADLLMQLPTVPSHLDNLFENALENLVNDRNSLTIEYYKHYLKQLYKNKNVSKLISEALRMHSLYEREPYPLEWICKVFAEKTLENTEFTMVDSIEKYIEALLMLNKESPLALLARGVLFWDHKNYLECRDLLQKAVTSRGFSNNAWILLIDCFKKLYCYSEMETAARQASTITENSSFTNMISIRLCEALSQQNEDSKITEAESLAKTILENDPSNTEIKIILARTLSKLKKYNEADKYLKELKDDESNLASLVLIESQKLQAEENWTEALNVLLSYQKQDNVEILLEKGKLLQKLDRTKESLITFLEAAKLDTNCYIAFLNLGHHYLKAKDIDRARRCYQKAFKLNSKSVEAGISLSNVYRDLNNWDANQILLEGITNDNIGDKKYKWAWLQLGLNHLHKGNHNEAVATLRNIIRNDPNDGAGWEALADAYLARGAYTAAMKSYQQAEILNPKALYPPLQIGAINQQLANFKDAIVAFEKILTLNPNYVPALKGLAETHLILAKSYFTSQLLGLSHDHLQKTIDLVTIALKEKNKLSCLWKILADTCSFTAAQMPEKHCSLFVSTALSTLKNQDGLSVLDQKELFILASRAYSRALNLTNTNILIWHDMACNYYFQGTFEKDDNVKKELMTNALTIIKHCITKNSSRWQHWNLLGVVSIELKHFKLAQHALIKAISLEKNNSISWANLGVLYLMNDDVKLANEAFTNAQRYDPNYVPSWIGQAFIAETLGYDDAMDLYRHSTQLGSEHSEAGIGYAYYVCSVLIKNGIKAEQLYCIKNMNAIPVAADVLEWYTEKNPKNSCALNMLGLLKERQTLYQSAANAFERALNTVENDSQRDQVLTNYARVLVRLNKFQEAIECYQNIKEANFLTGCGLALAYFKAELYQESYSTYETALNYLAPDDNNKSHVLVAMSAMAYMFQGPEDAKTLLFQCIQLDPPSVNGMFAACALGVLHGDLNLANLVLKELESFRNNSEYIYDIARLEALMYLAQNDHVLARKSLSKILHKYPTQARLWLMLSELLLSKELLNASAAVNCAVISIYHGRTTMDISMNLCLVSSAQLMSGNYKEALRVAQKATHSHPTVASCWVLLISSFYLYEKQAKNTCDSNDLIKKSLWLQKLLSFVHENLNPNDSLKHWLTNCGKLIETN